MDVRGGRRARQAVAAAAAVLVHAPVLYFLTAPAPAPDAAPADQVALQALILPPSRPRIDRLVPDIRPRFTVPKVRFAATDLALERPIEVPVEAVQPPRSELQSVSDTGALAAAMTVAPSAPAAPEDGGRGQARGTVGAAGSPGGVAVLHSVQPVYPPASVRLREQGTAILGVSLDDRGRPLRVRVLRSSGSRALDEAAMHALHQWRFSAPPAGMAGRGEVALSMGFHFADELGFHAVVVPFDAALVARINAAARRDAPASGTVTEQEVRAMAEKLRAANHSVSASGGTATARELVDRGAVQSVRFLGTVVRALDAHFDQSERANGLDAPDGDRLLWYAYAVSQERGTSEWLLATAGSGGVTTVEVMAGGPACTPQSDWPACNKAL